GLSGPDLSRPAASVASDRVRRQIARPRAQEVRLSRLAAAVRGRILGQRQRRGWRTGDLDREHARRTHHEGHSDVVKTVSVIASEAKQSRIASLENILDCFVAPLLATTG